MYALISKLEKSEPFSLHLFLQKLTEAEIILIDSKSGDFRAQRGFGCILYSFLILHMNDLRLHNEVEKSVFRTISTVLLCFSNCIMNYVVLNYNQPDEG